MTKNSSPATSPTSSKSVLPTSNQVASMSKSEKLPSISDHFKEAWDRLVANLLNLGILTFLSFFIGTIWVVVVIGVVALTTSFTPEVATVIAAAARDGVEALATMPSWYWGFLASALVLLVLGSAAISAVFQAAYVVVIGKSQEKPSLSQSVQTGIALAVPLVILNLVVLFLMFGNLMFFFLPGIFVIILTFFAVYELVLAGKGPIDAIKGSFHLVMENFGIVVVRALVFFVGWMLISYLINIMVSNESVSGIGIILSLIVNIFYPWFSVAYYAVLYDYVRRITPDQKPTYLGVLSVTAVIGWIVALLTVGSLVRLVGSQMNSDAWEIFREAFVKEMGLQDQNKNLIETNEEFNLEMDVEALLQQLQMEELDSEN
jgi:hypothetical protein